eukprot:6190747-Pleurochrysis_carterae.AAC.3
MRTVMISSSLLDISHHFPPHQIETYHVVPNSPYDLAVPARAATAAAPETAVAAAALPVLCCAVLAPALARGPRLAHIDLLRPVTKSRHAAFSPIPAFWTSTPKAIGR